MVRQSILGIIKIIFVILMCGFCVYQLHFLLHPRPTLRSKKIKQLSETETRTFVLLRVLVKKNKNLQQTNEQQQLILKQKIISLQNLIEKQKRLLDVQAQQLRSKVTDLTTTHHSDQQFRSSTQSGIIHVDKIQGQGLNLSSSVKVVSSTSPKTNIVSFITNGTHTSHQSFENHGQNE